MTKIEVKILEQKTKSLRLLFVEDNYASQEAMLDILHMFFDEITVAFNGKKALQQFYGQPFDLVITDIEMPVMNGIDMIKEIRKSDDMMPILIITAHNENVYSHEYDMLNIKDSLLKPLELKTFLTVLERFADDSIQIKKEKTDYAG